MPSYNSEGVDTNAEVQNNLLTIIEGTDITNKFNVTVNTDNIMFVGMGSFNAFRTTREKTTAPIGIFSGTEQEQNEKEKEDTDHYSEITRGDIIKAGGSYELIGRFPYIVNYHSYGRRGVISIIRSLMATISESFDCGLSLGEDMVEELVASANSEFGVRLIDSEIRKAVMHAFGKAITEEHDGKYLEIQLDSSTDISYYWRNPTDEEIDDDRLSSMNLLLQRNICPDRI